MLLGHLIEDADSRECLPSSMRSELAERSDVLAAIVGVLTTLEPPRWSTPLDFVRLMRVRDLHEMLVARALQQLEDGDAAEAQRALDAAWNLMSALECSREVLPLLLRWKGIRLECAALLRMPHIPLAWRERLDGMPRDEALRAAEVLRMEECVLLADPEGWERARQQWRDVMHEVSPAEPDLVLFRLPGAITRPWRMSRVAAMVDMHGRLLASRHALPADLRELEAIEYERGPGHLDVFNPFEPWQRRSLANDKAALIRAETLASRVRERIATSTSDVNARK